MDLMDLTSGMPNYTKNHQLHSVLKTFLSFIQIVNIFQFVFSQRKTSFVTDELVINP